MDLGDGASAKQAWMERFQTASQRIRELRSNPSGTMSSESGKSELRDLGAEAKTLARDLDAMAATPTEYFLSSSEVARRRSLLRGYEQQLRDLQSGKDAGSKGTDQAMQMRQRQRDMMRLQDDMIEDIGRGVDRLGNTAGRIKDETAVHVRLLDDMDVDVDRATAGLRAEARHAEKIRLKSQTCTLYIIIAVLSAILMLLIVLGFS